MTPVIRIDEEVMDELKKRAIVFGLVFDPPNTTLRRILELDNVESSVVRKQREISKLIQNSGNGEVFINAPKNNWPEDLMYYIKQMHKTEFMLEDVYKFEDELKVKHPKNQTIRNSIRWALQQLRDEGLIEFIRRGEYRIKNKQ
jgi:Dam-replacing HTH domain